MSKGSHKNANINWDVTQQATGFASIDWQPAILAVLMDIRHELFVLNVRTEVVKNRVNCVETMSIPRVLKQIRANTAKRRRKKVV